MQSCHELGVPAALEIFRPGDGAHAWVFFASRVSARDVRRLGTAIISHTCSRTRQLKLESYDRLFPNQDTMPQGGFDIAVMQSISRQGEVNPLVEHYGQVIVDECHHVGAASFDAILKRTKAKYVLGLTATPIRRDGQQPIIFMQCGPIRCTAPHDLEVFARSHCRVSTCPPMQASRTCFGISPMTRRGRIPSQPKCVMSSDRDARCWCVCVRPPHLAPDSNGWWARQRRVCAAIDSR